MRGRGEDCFKETIEHICVWLEMMMMMMMELTGQGERVELCLPSHGEVRRREHTLFCCRAGGRLVQIQLLL